MFKINKELFLKKYKKNIPQIIKHQIIADTETPVSALLKIFDKDYLRYLSTFRFDGLVRSMKNGSIFFPNESVLEITGNIIEGQILETNKISGSSYLPPIIVDETIYILNDNGDLTAYN